MRRARIAGAVLLLSAIAIAIAESREPAPVRMPVDAAPPDPFRRVALAGGAWDCDARVEARLTPDDVVWVPYRGARRTALVAFPAAPDCSGLPPPSGVLARMPEHAFERLRGADARWVAVAQTDLGLLFPGARPVRSRLPRHAALALGIAGLALLVAPARGWRR